jgi:leucyl aminopeptidase (aminopeptidase T)
MRRALTRADSMRLDWDVAGNTVALDLALGAQEAQKSHGLVRVRGDVANLPAGEVYWVPVGAEGLLPRQFEDAAGTIAVFDVRDGGIAGLHRLVRGDRDVVDGYLALIAEDPNAGRLTELGLGTQRLPWAHVDLQDEKILGTAHVATGRSDHLGGAIGSGQFRNPRNATHEDILYTPVKTPDVALRRVTMRRGGGEFPILEDYQPAAFLRAVVG